MAAGQSMLEQHLAELSSDARSALQAGKYAEAEEQYRRLIKMQQGPEHAYTLDSQTFHASALNFLLRPAEAETILREVLQVQQQSPSFGMEHEATLGSVRALGRCLLQQGRFQEAVPMLRKVHALDVRVLGARHMETLDIQFTLGNCLVGEEQHDEAESLLRDALEGFQAMPEIPGQPLRKAIVVGGAMRDLATCLFRVGKHVEAECMLSAAVRYTRHHIGEQYPATCSCMLWHAHSLKALEKHAAAEVMYRLAVQGYRAVFGWEHPTTLSATRSYVNCLLVQHKVVAAEALVLETVRHLQQVLEEDHPTVLEWMRDLAKILDAQCQVSKSSAAKALLRKARELERNRQQ